MAVERFLKAENIPLIEEAFQIEDIQHADEMFLSSSTSEVLPVIQLDNVVVGNGEPGKITRTLQRAYEQDAKITDKLIKNV